MCEGHVFTGNSFIVPASGTQWTLANTVNVSKIPQAESKLLESSQISLRCRPISVDHFGWPVPMKEEEEEGGGGGGGKRDNCQNGCGKTTDYNCWQSPLKQFRTTLFFFFLFIFSERLISLF